jgi:hypothetical protein
MTKYGSDRAMFASLPPLISCLGSVFPQRLSLAIITIRRLPLGRIAAVYISPSSIVLASC